MSDSATPPSSPPQPAPAPKQASTVQPHNPLHGVTLEAMVTALSTHNEWEGLGARVALLCFALDSSVPSSLKFLRKTPSAREKVEGLYLFMLREVHRKG